MKTLTVILALATVIFAAPALADHNEYDELGRKHGHWTERGANGDMREGHFVKGKRQGHWVRREADGTVHEGPMVEDKEQGRWVVRPANGDVYEGPFVNGRKHGRWVLRFANGSVIRIIYRNDQVVGAE